MPTFAGMAASETRASPAAQDNDRLDFFGTSYNAGPHLAQHTDLFRQAGGLADNALRICDDSDSARAHLYVPGFHLGLRHQGGLD